MGDIEYFTVDDLRRTCRCLLASLSVPPHVAERCLNHKLKGVEGIYDRYDYYQEREVAHLNLSKLLTKHVYLLDKVEILFSIHMKLVIFI